MRHALFLFFTVLLLSNPCNAIDSNKDNLNLRPTIILIMADDQGSGDVGYHGHPNLKTPNIDKMAESGIKLERFYAGAPGCSPTPGSALTGMHPFRYGIFYTNVGHKPKEELTLAETLKKLDYTTGHFGK